MLSREQIAQQLADAGVKLPLRFVDEHGGYVADARDESVFVVDQWSELPDGQARAISEALIAAVNSVAEEDRAI